MLFIMRGFRLLILSIHLTSSRRLGVSAFNQISLSERVLIGVMARLRMLASQPTPRERGR